MPETAIHSHHGSYLMPSLEHATVVDAMHPGILRCDPDTPITEVARIMATHHVHCVAVMGIAHDQSGESLVWGLISDFDLIRAGALRTETTARELAQQPVISVNPTTDLRDAGELMLRHHAAHLVVVDEERLLPIGIVSTLDLAGVLAWGEA